VITLEEQVTELEVLQSIDQKLDIIIDSLSLVHTASATVVNYGLVLVPLMLIITMMWWFFRQFLGPLR
jgi:hypothetical protein